MNGNVCFGPDPDRYPDGAEPPEEWGFWADPSGFCAHESCIEGNRIGRLYASSKRVAGMTRDEIEALKADRELIRDEYHGWVLDEDMGYVVVAEVAP